MSRKPSAFVTKTVASQRFSSVAVHREGSESRDSVAVIRGRTTSVDEQVTHAYRSLLAAAFPRGMALVAVGGYGRRELFQYSDIDLLLLVDKEPSTDQEREALSSFLRTLWDGSLRLSQSVRTVAECVRFDEHNVELSISLLDARFLIGDSLLYEQLAERLSRYFYAQRQPLLRRLCDLTQARHSKFHHTIYHLEPNIKEGPGGLRDIQTARWIAKLRQITPDTESALENAAAFLWDLRCSLHERYGRDNNVLTFDVQEELSPNPASWMRDYYRHARVVYRHALHAIEQCETATATGLIRSFRDWRSRLSNAEFTVVRDRVMLRSPQALAADPFLVLRLFEFVARHGIRLSLETERKVGDSVRQGLIRFGSKDALWPMLHGILALPHAEPAVRAMHETGLLGLLLPAWNKIESLVVRDFYHRYTVDEHTLVAVGHLDALRSNSDPRRRRFAELLAEMPDTAVLVLALLFHDIGKSEDVAGHAHASALEARRAMAQAGAPEGEQALVEFLVEHHLDLSSVMNGRDLGDSSTAADLARNVETLEKLRGLTLLTYADISAVNPEAMTPWRLEQLWRTYLVGHRELTRDLNTERIHLRLTDEKAGWLEGFPTRYLRTHTSQEIDGHIELARESRKTGVGLQIDTRSGAWQLTAVTADRTGLLAGLAGAVSSFGMNIVRAEAFSNDNGVVLDSLTFEDPMRTLELNPGEVDRMRSVIRKVVTGKEDVDRLLRGRPRPMLPSKAARIRPAVSFDNEASGTATLVEIIAQDRPGLLYDLASTFFRSGCSIEVILIDTEAHKAIDVFYVTADGERLSQPLQAELHRELLRVCET